mmetsp:Transcript_234/g.588  ORF Transcript_234/g.588 Transcript_234/m.588 type:complete len:765 (-) Transcript_234:117-2411(-)|eukprot:CAMPEP_0197199276 /NCGR_PEP_ID=MMETSP1423-20130617/33799_1 /TAXON_ID=476441 /ORGANISM="Pseudo-nitzschia heimii, Strain UNC1101" /LENGTH=764 /DNA_ID=CAMNT_0042653131 /DNA_START=194 /DNA_END=2488 /DNA_ORIENTATION=+
MAQGSVDSESQRQFGTAGTILEAAFVDPAYQWPSPEGVGKNAIELQASINIMLDDNESVQTTESQKERMTIPKNPALAKKKKGGCFSCCKTGGDSAIMSLAEYEKAKKSALENRKKHYAEKKARAKALRIKNRYNRVPEGILIYRLDTATQTISLMSDTHSKTDTETLCRNITVASAGPSPDKSRRGMTLTGILNADDDEDDANKEKQVKTVTLVACEQRTAISWLEAIDLMLANKQRMGDSFKKTQTTNGWNKKNLSGRELDQIEGQYLNLASYSNKLIRANKGSKKSTPGGAAGMYYSIEEQKDEQQIFEEEALESIAKRRAVIKDSWDFYRMICSLLRDRRKYSEVFRKLQLDSVYPYLHSMTGLNDPGDAGYENTEKEVIQKDFDRYQHMTRTQVAEDLHKQAEKALPSLVEICKALAGSLGMEEVGIGPIKEVQAALKKAERKYDGDLLKITDFCRALLVVKDLPSLLALLELARDSFGPLIRRVKLSSLKSDHKSLPGGYRHCVINLELREHICEIEVHLWPMWLVAGVDGFRHYRHCVEYNTDSFENAFDALEGLDRKTMAELLVMAEEAVAETPLESLEWFQEKFILDYFAEVGLFMKHGIYVWAEITLRQLVKLRTESPDIGPDHHETILLYTYLEDVLSLTGQDKEAKEIRKRIKEHDKRLRSEKDEAEKSMWDLVMAAPTEAIDMIMDPNKKERKEEEKLRKEVKASKKQWRAIRKQRFAFLDANASSTGGATTVGSVTTAGMDEKKADESKI